MNVGQLKKVLASVADYVPVLVEGGDHSFLSATADVTSVEFHKKYGYAEYYGTDNMADGSVVRTGLVVSSG